MPVYGNGYAAVAAKKQWRPLRLGPQEQPDAPSGERDRLLDIGEPPAVNPLAAKAELEKDGKKEGLNITWIVWLALQIGALVVAVPLLLTAVNDVVHDIDKIAANDVAPCSVTRPRFDEIDNLLGKFHNSENVARAALCAFPEPAPSNAYKAVTVMLGRNARNFTYQATDERQIVHAMCAVDYPEDLGTPDPLVRLERSYLAAQTAFRYFYVNKDNPECQWSANPVREGNCAAHAEVLEHIADAASGSAASGHYGAMPDIPTIVYRLAVISIIAESDNTYNGGRCLGNAQRHGAAALCSIAWEGGDISVITGAAPPAPQASPPPSAKISGRGNELEDYELYYSNPHTQTCADLFAPTQTSPPSPPPSPPRGLLEFQHNGTKHAIRTPLNPTPARALAWRVALQCWLGPLQWWRRCLRLPRIRGTLHITDRGPPRGAGSWYSHSTAWRQCRALHSIGPYDVKSLFSMPDLRFFASPYGGSSFAESMVGWIYTGIVADYWRGEVLYNSRRQTLLYALYRQAATYVWLVPALYVFGWSFANIVLPSAFVLFRFLYNRWRGGYSTASADGTPAPLFTLAMAMPVARPPYGPVRYMAMFTTALLIAWVFLVSPFPERPISRPTCKDSDGRLFKQSDALLALTSLSILGGLFVGSVVYMRFLHKKTAAFFSKGKEADFAVRRRAQYIALALAMTALPGSVVSLVHVMKETIEQLTLVGNNWEIIQDSVRKTVHFSEILIVTAFSHGAAVGVWSNTWMVSHPASSKGFLSLFKIFLPLGIAALAFAPRFYKLVYRPDDWFWCAEPQPRLPTGARSPSRSPWQAAAGALGRRHRRLRVRGGHGAAGRAVRHAAARKGAHTGPRRCLQLCKGDRHAGAAVQRHAARGHRAPAQLHSRQVALRWLHTPEIPTGRPAAAAAALAAATGAGA